MEAAIVNLIQPDDAIIVGINGIFGTRLASMVERCGGQVIPLAVPWGQPLDPEHIKHHLKATKHIKAVAIVHAETSTGVLQPLENIGQLGQQHEALYIVDTVTTLGGHGSPRRCLAH
ncbi:aminotransferase class V-fold PLP-dependent enzyme [Candidatus Nitrospira salsa]